MTSVYSEEDEFSPSHIKFHNQFCINSHISENMTRKLHLPRESIKKFSIALQMVFCEKENSFSQEFRRLVSSKTYLWNSSCFSSISFRYFSCFSLISFWYSSCFFSLFFWFFFFFEFEWVIFPFFIGVAIAVHFEISLTLIKHFLNPPWEVCIFF